MQQIHFSYGLQVNEKFFELQSGDIGMVQKVKETRLGWINNIASLRINKTSPILSHRATLYSEGEKVKSFW